MINPFENFSDNPSAPALSCFAIAPSDAIDLPNVTKAVYVGTGGDITLRSADDATDVVFRNVPSGFILSVRVRAVRGSGTTASDLVGLA